MGLLYIGHIFMWIANNIYNSEYFVELALFLKMLYNKIHITMDIYRITIKNLFHLKFSQPHIIIFFFVNIFYPYTGKQLYIYTYLYSTGINILIIFTIDPRILFKIYCYTLLLRQ